MFARPTTSPSGPTIDHEREQTAAPASPGAARHLAACALDGEEAPAVVPGPSALSAHGCGGTPLRGRARPRGTAVGTSSRREAPGHASCVRSPGPLAADQPFRVATGVDSVQPIGRVPSRTTVEWSLPRPPRIRSLPFSRTVPESSSKGATTSAPGPARITSEPSAPVMTSSPASPSSRSLSPPPRMRSSPPPPLPHVRSADVVRREPGDQGVAAGASEHSIRSELALDQVASRAAETTSAPSRPKMSSSPEPPKILWGRPRSAHPRRPRRRDRCLPRRVRRDPGRRRSGPGPRSRRRCRRRRAHRSHRCLRVRGSHRVGCADQHVAAPGAHECGRGHRSVAGETGGKVGTEPPAVAGAAGSPTRATARAAYVAKRLMISLLIRWFSTTLGRFGDLSAEG